MYTFFKAFSYAWSGIVHALKNERNFKFHLLATIIVVLAGLLTGLSSIEWFIIIILIGGMLSLEMMNSAVERVVDLTTTEQRPLAKQAKDLAAGAVLIYAIVSAVIGLILFVPKWFN
ncbi:diacylglycerol kinase family protein [Sporosarcina limicola]|uniref:Undecaprenol kinase n=1 Tax=Sporosarcina limicola TaxID=34101 RepID=A0A927MFJ5_9BACL|nr:diacylglycerol kinase family protein [Sporosarcina limicola]MBE1553718.1 undecaprenol kinase [Sporosarcina limicola]